MTQNPNGEPRLGRDPELVQVSNSEIQLYKSCRRAWWLSSYRGLVPREEKLTGPLPLGSRVHNALEQYYRDGRDMFEAYAELLKIDEIEFSQTIQANDDEAVKKFNNEAELGRVMLEGYEEWLKETNADHGLEVVGVEKIVSHRPTEFEGKVELRGKLDLIIRDKFNGFIASFDHKALRASSRVYTPSGFKQIGDLAVGDLALAPTGETAEVTGVYPQGKVQLYRVTFNDYSYVDACADHRWSVSRKTHRGVETAVKTTHELIADLNRVSRTGSDMPIKWAVPYVDAAALDFETGAEMPLSAYALGIWLGDGRRQSLEFCSWDTEIVEQVAKSLVDVDAAVKQSGDHGYRMVFPLEREADAQGRRYARSQCISWMKRVGLWDTYSHQRFVPDAYKYTTAENRLELLRGILDSDGIATKHGHFKLSATSSTLVDDTAWLVRSLGGRATVAKNTSSSGYRNDVGEWIDGRPVYTVNIKMPLHVNPFHLSRKAVRFSQTRTEPRPRVISSIEPVDVDNAVCITVDSADHTFVTDDFIVTHNTAASFDTYNKYALMSEQLMFYTSIMVASHEREVIDGGIYNLLKKSKRTARAKGPFYTRMHIRFNKATLQSFWLRTLGTVRDMMSTRKQLDEGVPHQLAAYPRPSNDCSWKCPFYQGCTMFDDGSRAEEWLAANFVVGNPDARYDLPITPVEKTE